MKREASHVLYKTNCDKCGSSDANAVYSDGHSFCYACHKSNYPKRGEEMQSNVVQGRKYGHMLPDLAAIQTFPHKEITARGISKEIAQEYGVRCAVSETTGQVTEVYYPLYGDDGTIVAYKIRKLPKDFAVAGDFNKAKLFGQQLYEGKRRKLLMVTEGQDDCLAAKQLLKANGKDYAVVSLHNANMQGRLDRSILDAHDFFMSFETIVLCLDNDKPGQATQQALADWLASDLKVMLMKLPDGIKDCNDFILQERQDEFYKCFLSCSQYHPAEIVSGADYSLEELMKPRKKGLELPYPELMTKTSGFAPGELVLVAAGSGGGKTSWLKQLVFYWLDKYESFKVGGVFLEDSVQNVLQSFIAIANKVPVSRLAENPDVITKEAWQATYEKYIANERINLVNSQLSQSSDDLVNKVKYLAKAKKCQVIIVDNLLASMSGNKEGDERRNIDAFVEQLAKIAVDQQCCIILVNHLKRTNGKNIHEGDAIELTDLRGSGSLEALASTVIALERDQQAEEEYKRNIVKIRVLKNRRIGRTGVADHLVYNTATGIMELYEQDY